MTTWNHRPECFPNEDGSCYHPAPSVYLGRLQEMTSACVPGNGHLSMLRPKRTSLGPHCLSSDVPFASIESVLVSSYVHLEFSSTAWPQELSKNFTLPTALAVLPPKTLTGLGLTTGSGCMGLPADGTPLPNSPARQLAQDAVGSPTPYFIAPGP